MLDVRTDAQRKRIHLTIAGVNDPKATSDAAARLLAAAKAIGPGFDLVNDVSAMKIGSDEVGKIITRTQAELTKLGPRRIVRVVGKSAMASMLMSRTGREAGVTYTVQQVATVAEADALLDKPA